MFYYNYANTLQDLGKFSKNILVKMAICIFWYFSTYVMFILMSKYSYLFKILLLNLITPLFLLSRLECIGNKKEH